MYKPDFDNVTEISNSSDEINGKHTNYLAEMSKWKLHTDGLGYSIYLDSNPLKALELYSYDWPWYVFVFNSKKKKN